MHHNLSKSSKPKFSTSLSIGECSAENCSRSISVNGSAYVSIVPIKEVKNSSELNIIGPTRPYSNGGKGQTQSLFFTLRLLRYQRVSARLCCYVELGLYEQSVRVQRQCTIEDDSAFRMYMPMLSKPREVLLFNPEPHSLLR